MFEVDWTDYDRELVGERKARKEIQRDRKKKEDCRSGRASISTRSSSSSSEKPFGFFGSIGLKKRQNSSKNKKTLSSAVLQTLKDGGKVADDLDLIPEIPADTSISTGMTSIDSESKAPSSLSPLETNRLPYLSGIDWAKALDHSISDSMFSKLTEITASSPTSTFGSSAADPGNSTTRSIQVLGADSYVTQTTDVEYEIRRETDRDAALSEITIAAEPPKPQSPTPPNPPAEEITHSTMDNAAAIEGRANQFPLLSPDFEPQESSDIISQSQRPKRQSNRQRRHHSVVISPHSFPIKFQADNPDSWKPPDAWECSPTVDMTCSVTKDMCQTAEAEETAGNSMAMNLPAMQRELRRMAAASPQIMLARLTEEWGRTPDASFYKELEMEKKQWMLSALFNLDRPQREDSRIHRETLPKSSKILALFETKATASYLAALHINTPITHLASSTLSNALFPNVHPLLSPVASNGALSLAPNSFTAVHCLCLPSIVASSEIPRLLKNIHRCLIPKGVLHLAIIDPQPVASTLGPRLRTWLENNLMLNLEKNFRCVSPTRLFPSWLADNQLRGDGSSIINMKFRAIPGVLQPEEYKSNIPEAEREERRIRTELRSVVGRMLWQEVWGQYANADYWWWEDSECVQECVQFSTHWEYSIIEAVTSSD